MEDILKRSEQNQDQMSSRVTALLAGSSLTTTAGVRIERRDTVDQIDYTAVGKSYLLSKPLFPPSRLSVHVSVRVSVTLQHLIPLIAPEAPSASV